MKQSLNKKEVQEVFSGKQIFRTECFIYRWKFSDSDHSRVTFAFSRNRGSAVKRNLFKRRFRDLVRRRLAGYKVDLIVSARKSLVKITDQDWKQEVRLFLEACEKNFIQ